MTPEIASAVRAILLILSSLAQAHGYYNAGTGEQIVSGFVALAIVLWGILAKRPGSGEAQAIAGKVNAMDAKNAQGGFVSLPVAALISLSAVILSMYACAQLNLQKPETFNQKAAYAYANVTGVRLSAYQALKEHQIAPAQAERVLEITDQARTALDRAVVLHSHSDAAQPDALSTLALAEDLILQAQAILMPNKPAPGRSANG